MTEALWRDYFSTRDVEIREELIRTHLPLVNQIAGRLSLGLPTHIDKEDLISCGIVGLMEAMERYDPAKGTAFSTFAAKRIRGAMLDELRRLSWVPRTFFQRLRYLQQAEDKIKGRKERDPSVRELAKELGWSSKEVEEVYAQINCLSLISLESLLFSPAGEKKGGHEIEGNMGDPATYLEFKEKEDILSRAIEDLPERDRVLLSLYYKEELTLKEIARVMDVTPARISQLHARVIKRLRKELRQQGFEELISPRK